MCPPISCTMTQTAEEFLEENITQYCDFLILYFKRYVDDCIAEISKDKIDLEQNNI